MNRTVSLVGILGFCLGLSTELSAQEIQRGKLKSIDVKQRLIVITSAGGDVELTLTDSTEVLSATGKDLAEKLKDFKPGADLYFKPGKRDGKSVAQGLKLIVPGGKPISPEHAHLKPLDELGVEKYQGFVGGFYPDGQNRRPAEHEAAGLAFASQVQPRNSAGKPDPNGKIVLLSIGMSNTSQSSQGFQEALSRFDGKNPNLVFVNGAQGGMTAAAIQDPDDGGRGTQYWNEVDNRLKQAGVTREQVQAVWIKQADAGPRNGFPAYARTLQTELVKIVQTVNARFSHARLCYLSSRTYGGFATTALNPEPYAYESGFAVKWLIEEQLKGNPGLNYGTGNTPVVSPWLSWGPYLWANGVTERSADGFHYQATDFGNDGTHHSPAGSRKVATLMLDFFKSDATTMKWFNKP